MLRTSCKFLFALGLMVLVAGGCKEQQEPPQPQSPVVVRKKVEVPQPPTVQAERPSDQEAPQPVTTEVPPEPEAPLELAKAEPAASETAPALPEAASTPEPSPEEKEGEEAKDELAYSYDPKGKIDPFQSVFVMQAREATRVDTKGVAQKLPLTPLQKIDLSQLKVVGIILAEEGNKALVEDPSGKGYVITRGTFVGANFGRVRSILKDRIVVEEEVEDFFTGQMRLQTVELMLQKKLGEV